MNITINLPKTLCLGFFVINSLLYTQEKDRSEFLGLVEAKISSQKGVWRFIDQFEFTKAKQNKQLSWEIGITYGLTESLGIEFFLPVSLQNVTNDAHSKGIGDCVSNLQWTFFSTPENLASLQGGIKFPTGSTSLNPPTGSGTYDGTVQFLAIHSSDEWFSSIEIGSRITTKHKAFKPGNFFAYQLMFGKTVTINKEDNYILNFNLNMSGLYIRPDRIDKVSDPNTGGNVIFFGPLIAYSYKNFLVEYRFQLPIAQNLFGNQPNVDYTTALSFVLKF